MILIKTELADIGTVRLHAIKIADPAQSVPTGHGLAGRGADKYNAFIGQRAPGSNLKIENKDGLARSGVKPNNRK